MGNYFSSLNKQINNSINNKKIDKFNRYKNEPFYINNIKYNIYIPSLTTIKE